MCQSLLDDSSDEIRIGFDAGEFHDLAAEEAGGRFGFLGIFDHVLYCLLINGEDLVNPDLSSGCILDLDEAQFFCKLHGGGGCALGIRAGESPRLIVFQHDLGQAVGGSLVDSSVRGDLGKISHTTRIDTLNIKKSLISTL